MKRLAAVIAISAGLAGCGTSTDDALKKACAKWQSAAAATGQNWASVSDFPAGLGPSDCSNQ